MGFPVDRPRRLRRTAALRRLVAETRLHPADFVLPLFVKEGISEPFPVGSMPGVLQHTRDSLRKTAHEAVEAGVGGVILFGIPEVKDATGTQADATNGIVQQALRDLSADLGDDAVLMADLCLCEYTDHGHCGPLTADGVVDNDVTISRYASIAVAQAEAGADIIAPSGMMDGQVAAIRDALDASGFDDRVILAYAAKYASAFYGPFRDAAESAPSQGDKTMETLIMVRKECCETYKYRGTRCSICPELACNRATTEACKDRGGISLGHLTAGALSMPDQSSAATTEA